MKTFYFRWEEKGIEINVEIITNSFAEAERNLRLYFGGFLFSEGIKIERILEKSKKISQAIDFMSRLDPNGDFEGASALELLEILDGWKNEFEESTDSRGKAILNGINKIMDELKMEA